VAVTHPLLITQTDGDHNCLWLIGGRRRNEQAASTIYSTMYCYDLAARHWIEKKSLPYAVSAGTAVPRGANFILLIGGDRGETFLAVEQLNLAAQKAVTQQEKDSLTQQANALSAAHPGFNKELLLYNTITDTWTSIGHFPYPPPATATAINWEGDIVIASGEIRAGIRTPQIIKGSIQKKAFFSTLDYGILVLYFLAMIWIGWRTSRHQASTEDYFKGGKKIPAWASGLSIFGAKLSAITFISIPAKTYALDWTNFFFLMTIVMVMPIVLKYFIPFYRKLNVTTAYEYLQTRFNYGVRLLASMLFVLLQIGRMGIVLLLPSLALSVVTGIDVMTGILIMGIVSVIYTVMGGIEAVIWTEVVQVLILLCGALITMIVIPFMIPDWHGAWNDLQLHHKLRVIDWAFDFTRPTFWVVLLGGLAAHINIYGCDQTVVQRYLTTKDENEAKKSLRLGAWMTVPSTIVFFTIGTLLYMFYKSHPASANIALESQDTIFPWFMVSQLPRGISGLVITAIFAASMGSLNSSVNSVATVMVNDWFKVFLRNRSEKTYLNLARYITLGIGVFATVIALLMAKLNIPSLWDQFNMLVGFFTGGIAGVFLLGIFSKKANGPGVLLGLICSAMIQYLIKYQTSLSLFLYAVTGLASSIILGWLFSLLFKQKK
ncbi:MAG: sodium/solute symporter, partial [Bacteroidetes bacterium]|nr:sodium/solute symporter [Bacteroidota bacterium]